jgi:hypothetical protein
MHERNFKKLATFSLNQKEIEELDGPAVRALGVRSRKLSNVRKDQSTDGWPKFIISSSSVFRKVR